MAVKIKVSKLQKKIILSLFMAYLNDLDKFNVIKDNHKQNVLSLVKRTSNPSSQAIIDFLLTEYNNWLELSPEDIEYMQGKE